MFKKCVIMLVALVLTGCATSYQPKSYTGGYTDTKLDDDKYRVTFSGNQHTSADRVEEYALLRAAEITLEYGYSHFVTVSESGDSVSRYSATQAGTVREGKKHQATIHFVMMDSENMNSDESRIAINARIYWEELQ